MHEVHAVRGASVQSACSRHCVDEVGTLTYRSQCRHTSLTRAMRGHYAKREVPRWPPPSWQGLMPPSVMSRTSLPENGSWCAPPRSNFHDLHLLRLNINYALKFHPNHKTAKKWWLFEWCFLAVHRPVGGSSESHTSPPSQQHEATTGLDTGDDFDDDAEFHPACRRSMV